MESLKVAYRRTAIISGAIAFTLPIYAIVVAVFQQMSGSFRGISPAEDGTTLTDVLFLISLATFFLAWRIRNRTFRTAPPRPGTELKESTTARDSKKHLQLLTRTTLVTLVLSESIAMYGLAGFIVTGDARVFYLLLTVSIIAFILWFPRYGQWQEWIERQRAGNHYEEAIQ